MKLLILSVILLSFGISANAELDLNLEYVFSSLDFGFPNKSARDSDIEKGFFIPGASVPIDLHVQHTNKKQKRTFVTIPRQGPGRPFTLAVIDEDSESKSPALFPYPNYSWNANQGTNCKGLTSVFRVWGDECDRLWVLDAGRIGLDLKCPPQLLAFDLKTDKLIRRHVFPSDMINFNRSILVDPIADVQSRANKCRKTFVYVSDAPVGSLLVYDNAADESWKIENPLFQPDPQFVNHTIAGETFFLPGGILGLALYPKTDFSPAKRLYFHSFAAITENYVDTEYIKNGKLFKNNPNAVPDKFKELNGSRETQAVAHDFDKCGRLYFGSYDPPSILRWDKSDPFGDFETVAEDYDTLQFMSGIKVIEDPRGDEILWALSSRYQKFATGTLNPNETNFRIFSAVIDN